MVLDSLDDISGKTDNSQLLYAINYHPLKRPLIVAGEQSRAEFLDRNEAWIGIDRGEGGEREREFYRFRQ